MITQKEIDRISQKLVEYIGKDIWKYSKLAHFSYPQLSTEMFFSIIMSTLCFLYIDGKIAIRDKNE